MNNSITEFRQIFFTDDDVKKALIVFNKKQNKKFLKGPIREFNVTKNEDGEFEVDLKVDLQLGGKTENVKLPGAFLGAAILNYCFLTGIPIPKRSNKKIDIIDERIVMQITVLKEET